MTTYKTRIGFFIICSTLICQQAGAQMSGQIGEFELLPQRVYANPAFQPAGKFNFGIPALSGMYAEHSNNWFRPARDLASGESGAVRIDGASVLNNIDDEALMMGGMGVELLHAGVKFGKHYVHFRAAERARFELAIPRDVFVLGVYGNTGHSQFENNTANLSNLRVNGVHYREYVLGYSIDLEKWQVGITAKYLYGMECISTAESGLKLHTDQTTYAMQTSGSFLVNTSGIYGAFSDDGDAIHQNMGRYVMGLNNNGFGADIGGVYKPMDKLTVNLAVNDLGFITWRTDIANYGTNDASFAFNGVDLTDFIFSTGSEFDSGLDAEVEQLLNDLEEVYGFERTTSTFRTNLNGFARLGASYEVLDNKLGKGKVWANGMRGLGEFGLPLRISAGYNQMFWKKIEASLHITNQQGAGTFYGGGIVMMGGPFQLWCMVESLRAASLTRVNITDAGQQNSSTIVYPENAGDLRLHFGMNLVFAAKDSKKASRPMVR
jgi:hypothetical protein